MAPAHISIQADLDTARRRYRREYDRGYLLEQQGHAEHAQRVLDAANRELKKAEDRYAKRLAAR